MTLINVREILTHFHCLKKEEERGKCWYKLITLPQESPLTTSKNKRPPHTVVIILPAKQVVFMQCSCSVHAVFMQCSGILPAKVMFVVLPVQAVLFYTSLVYSHYHKKEFGVSF